MHQSGLTRFTTLVQKVAKNAEPAANKLGDKMEGGAHKFAEHAPAATKEFSDKAVDIAHDVSKNAKPKAHKVSLLWLVSSGPQTCVNYNLSIIACCAGCQCLRRGFGLR